MVESSFAKFLMFDDGEMCPGNKGRAARVEIDCQEAGSDGGAQGGSREQGLHSADEPSVCNYTMTLSLPLQCSQLSQNLEVEAGAVGLGQGQGTRGGADGCTCVLELTMAGDSGGNQKSTNVKDDRSTHGNIKM